jgi:hypothetical protein
MQVVWALALFIVAATAAQARSTSAGEAATSQATSADPAGETLQALLEHMVRAQFGTCPGVEVHKRGGGFIAGRYGGPMVIVSVDGACGLVPVGKDEQEAVLQVRWATRLPGSSDEIAVMRRTIRLNRLRCPNNFMTALLRREVAHRAPNVCEDAFTPTREAMSLADFFHPVLSPLGTMQLSERDGIGAVTFTHEGRRFELQGTLTCQPVSNEVEGLMGGSGMRSLHVIGNLTLRDLATGDMLGRWNEPMMQNLGINCAVAFGNVDRNTKVKAAMEKWRERILERLGRARPLPSSSSSSSSSSTSP